MPGLEEKIFPRPIPVALHCCSPTEAHKVSYISENGARVALLSRGPEVGAGDVFVLLLVCLGIV